MEMIKKVEEVLAYVKRVKREVEAAEERKEVEYFEVAEVVEEVLIGKVRKEAPRHPEFARILEAIIEAMIFRHPVYIPEAKEVIVPAEIKEVIKVRHIEFAIPYLPEERMEEVKYERRIM